MPLQPISMINFIMQHGLPEVFDDSLSYYEAVTKLMAKINSVAAEFNNMITEVNKKEYSTDITTRRKLSPTGNFTGTINGKTILSIFADINDSLSLSQTIIDMINARESIGSIYDGGSFIETVPPTITIEGGLF
jgi:hypothetical protein